MLNVQYSMEEVLYYLEEVIQSDVSIEVEERVYEDLKWQGRCRSKDLKKVYVRMNEWYDY